MGQKAEKELLLSIVVPVYNRPHELEELLESLAHQGVENFEVIVVDDGSTQPSRDVCKRYTELFPLRYQMQENTGPALARNRGALKMGAKGRYVIFLDSDVIVPANYLYLTEHFLNDSAGVDLWGGPDASMKSFTGKQKAISYAMTSMLSTGGIRGGGELADKFYPRTFNMGVRLDALREVGGFSDMRYGEDVDLSMRLVEAGYRSQLFPDLFVYHKRRTRFRAFLVQTFHSGEARLELNKRHKGALRLVHVLPSVAVSLFVLGMLLPILAVQQLVLGLALAYSTIVFIHASLKLRSVRLGLLSVVATATMILGYGTGLIAAAVGMVREE